MRLSEDAYRLFESSYIARKYLDAAGVYEVNSLEGQEHVGRNGSGDYAGIVFQYRDPVTRQVVAERLRLFNPPLDYRGKPEHKYLSPPGQRNHIYWPLADPAWLEDPSMPILIVEGEKKYLAAHRASFEGQLRNGRPHWFTIAFSGVWTWRGVIGATNDKDGKRVQVKGTIPDIDRVTWKPGRRSVVCFDSNTSTNDMVRIARAQFAKEIASRGAEPYFIDLPGVANGIPVNGPDDFMAAMGGSGLFIELFYNAIRWNWHDELKRNESKKKILPLLSNGLLALRLAPELHEIVGFNEFAQRPEVRRRAPWNPPIGPWSDENDSQLREWLEKKGLVLSAANVTAAVLVVAKENVFHPVREYVNALKWDGVGRLDDWLVLYVGVEPSDYSRVVGAKWMIGGAARIFEPGCKMDSALILEGDQGTGKSRLLQILGGPFYSDDIAELGTKDAALGAAGVWIVELAELDAMSRADVSRIKSFISRQVDRFRPPYGRHVVEAPRQCIFAGSVNHCKYLKDETGGRRFWPVVCGKINLASLRRDRDQLWAEAAHRYHKGEAWFLEDKEIIRAASEQQEGRYVADPWEPLIEAWLLSQSEVSTADVLTSALQKASGQWTRTDEMRVGAVLARLGWDFVKRTNESGKRRRIYQRKEEEES